MKVGNNKQIIELNQVELIRTIEFNCSWFNGNTTSCPHDIITRGALRLSGSASEWYHISHQRGLSGQVTLLNCHSPPKWKGFWVHTLILTPKASLHGGSCEPPRLCSTRTEWVLFRHGTAAWGPASCDLFTPHPSLRPSFCQQKRCRAVTLRLSGLFFSRGPCNQRERRLTVWHCDPDVLSKNISPSNGAALFCPDLSTHHSPQPRRYQWLPSSTWAWSRQRCSHNPAFYFFFNPRWPNFRALSRPLGLESIKTSGSCVREVDGSDEIRKHTHIHTPTHKLSQQTQMADP